jgi:hypothetical protein
MDALYCTTLFCAGCYCCASSGIATAPPAPPQQTVLENAAERAVKTAEKVISVMYTFKYRILGICDTHVIARGLCLCM